MLEVLGSLTGICIVRLRGYSCGISIVSGCHGSVSTCGVDGFPKPHGLEPWMKVKVWGNFTWMCTVRVRGHCAIRGSSTLGSPASSKAIRRAFRRVWGFVLALLPRPGRVGPRLGVCASPATGRPPCNGVRRCCHPRLRVCNHNCLLCGGCRGGGCGGIERNPETNRQHRLSTISRVLLGRDKLERNIIRVNEHDQKQSGGAGSMVRGRGPGLGRVNRLYIIPIAGAG